MASLKRNIAALSATQDAKTQKALIAKIVKQLSSAGNKASPKVIAALEKYETRLEATGNSQAISPEDFEQAKALDQALPSLAKLYAKNEGQSNVIKNISRSLANIQYLHITKTLEPFWKSGKNPEPDSYAGKLASDPAFNSDTPWKGPNWMASQPQPAKVAAPQGMPGILTMGQFPQILIPTHADMINIGGQSVRRTLFPNVPNGTGDDIPSILAAGNNASDFTQIMLYEETLDEDVASIIAGLKQGRSYDIVADYSNLFPTKLGFKNETRSPQLQQLVDAYLGGNRNLTLNVLKGLGRIGIQHAKYRIWNVRLPNGNTGLILQTGSYNYSQHSQDHNWENVVLIDDPKLIAFYQKYFKWAKSLSRPFSEDLAPTDPIIKTMIPQDSALVQSFYDVPLPIASFSPNGGTGDAWTKIINNSKQDVFVGMFGFYHSPDLVSKMIARLDSGLSLRVLADAKQSHNPASIADMKRVKDAGALVRTIGGASGDGLFHNKLLTGDSKSGSGIVATGSTNMSINGNQHNFENTLYLKDSYLGALTDFLEALWNMGTDADFTKLSTPLPQTPGNTPGPQHP